MQSRSFSWVVLALALTVGAAVAPGRASAQAAFSDDFSLGLGISLAAVPSALVVGMAVADTVSFAMGTPFDTALAVGDLVTGGITVVTSLIFIGVAVNSAVQGDATDPVPFGACGAVGLALGSYEIAHGIWSIANLGSSQPPPVVVAPVPIRGGLSLSAAGTF